MLRQVCIACFLLCVLDWESSYAVGISKQEKEQGILKRLINEERYDKRVRPSGQVESGPTIVFVNLYLRDIDFVDETNMEYGVQMTFRQEWMDSRLAYNATRDIPFLTLTDRSQLWIPDLFFSNEKTSHLHDLMVPNHYTRIYPDGNVLYSSRITMKLRCPMSLKLFPFDEQKCQLRMASYGYTTDDIIFKFKEVEPLQLPKKMHLPKFALGSFETQNCDSTTNTGTYSCINVELTFVREFASYLILTYIPCTMIVIVSWLGCWLDKNSVTGRILIGLSTLFVLAMQTSELNAGLPPTGYTKAIDVWTGMSLTFVFACLLEFIIVNYLARQEAVEEKGIEEPQENGNNEEIPLNQKHLEVEVEEPKKNIRTTAQNWVSKLPPPPRSRKVDDIFRIAYPITFALFCIIYFIAY